MAFRPARRMAPRPGPSTTAASILSVRPIIRTLPRSSIAPEGVEIITSALSRSAWINSISTSSGPHIYVIRV